MGKRSGRIGAVWACVWLSMTVPVQAQGIPVAVDSDRWTRIDAEVVEYLGRRCLSGAVMLEDVAFQNGIIEVDVALSGERSYPGIVFRKQSDRDFERVYVRPHRAGLYPDAIQYTPTTNGVAGWQLYNGTGYTAGAELPRNQWIPLRLEVLGTQARFYIGDGTHPALEIHQLERGTSRGSIGLLGPTGGSACFSDFRYTLDGGLEFDPPPEIEQPAGVITNWEVSDIFKAERANRSSYPHFSTLFYIGWDQIEAAPSGLVDLAQHRQRTPGGADGVLARTVIRSNRRQDVTFHFGYSDEIDVFLNGHKVFAGNSTYQFRDPSFLGIVGFNDALTLTLEKGLNEVFSYVVENSHGWGFKARVDGEVLDPVEDSGALTRLWTTTQDFLTPESVVFDRERGLLYITNFDNWYRTSAPRTGFISTMNLDGQILEPRWVTDLDSPAGAGLWQDKLFVLERGVLAEIDVSTATVVERYPIPDSEFANDLAIDHEGNIYISDTRPSTRHESRIYRFRDGEFEVWLQGGPINWANGLFIHDDELLVGNSGDGKLKAVNLATKQVRDIVCLGARVLDGIAVDREGNYLVSHWEGQLYRASPTGDVVQILDLQPEGLNTAAFEYLAEQNLLILPTFSGNRVIAYQLTGN